MHKTKYSLLSCYICGAVSTRVRKNELVFCLLCVIGNLGVTGNEMPERAGSFYIVSIHKINRYVKLVSATFSPEDEQTTMDLIAQISAKLPFCIKLTPDQRKRLPKLDDGRIPFVDKGLDFGLQQPKVLPPFIDLTEMKKDIDFVKATRRVGAALMSLTEMLDDTRMAAGSDAYQAALSIYSSAKSAAKQEVPGTQTIVDEMGKLFEGQGENAAASVPTTK